MKKVSLLLILAVALSGTAFGHNGITNFLPTVPDPLAITIDGDDSDWGWYDRDFALTDIQSVLGQRVDQGVNPAPEDFSMAWFQAWSPPPDNAYYFFTRVQDDTLRIGWGADKGNWWDDDNLNFMFDADHGGGPTTGNSEITDFENGYRYHISPAFVNEVGIHVGGLGGPGANGDFQPWGIDPQYAQAAATVIPADFEHLEPNVEYTIELKAKVWDIYSIDGPESSVQHVFAPDQTLHILVQFEEGDEGDHGESDFWGQAGATYTALIDSDQSTDALTLLTEEIDDSYPDSWSGGGGRRGTAVENKTWGRIKATMGNK